MPDVTHPDLGDRAPEIVPGPTDPQPSHPSNSEGGSVDRRAFLGGAGTLAAGAIAGSAVGLTPGAARAEGEIAPETGFQRRDSAFRVRVAAADFERQFRVVRHPTNGDEDRYANRIGNFSKTLPHDEFGEVDRGAYDQLLRAISRGSFDAFEDVPAGGTQSLLNPLGGLAFNLQGADSAALGVRPPPPLASAEWAAQMAELYWMALLRDVPFAEFETRSIVKQAADDLSSFSGYTGPRDPETGMVTPQVLFRAAYPGATEGPLVSQFLLAAFSYDGIPIDPRLETTVQGTDFLTRYSEWLDGQRGMASFGGAPADPILRYPRSPRDLGQIASRDTIGSVYFRAAIVLQDLFGFGVGEGYDPANPYFDAVRQGAFSTFGIAHLAMLVGLAHVAERHAWYHKWNVHRFLRPEAGGGRVHNAVIGARDYPIHPDLLGDQDLLDLVFEYNRQQNLQRLGVDEGSFLLPQMNASGGPTHPAFPSGHAVSAGACIAVLKAWFNEDAEFPDPVMPNADGTELVPYEGPPLTIGGELNKLCHNLSWGRDMSGVHWRSDNDGGNLVGENVAIRILKEDRLTYPERFGGFTLHRFDGTTITI